MLSALVYLQYHSIRNRTALRLRRLRQPKYLFGAIVGGIYFYFYFIRYLFGIGGGRRPPGGWGTPGENQVLYESLGALVLFTLVFFAWVLPRQRAALAFSEAEVAFLFPAPITRRGLIHYKLLRSQLAILFTTFFLVLLSNRFGGNALIHAAGWWVALSTLNLHFLGASFARTMLLDRGITNWQRRLAVLALFAIGAIAAILWARLSFPEFDISQFKGPEDLKDYAKTLLSSGPLPWLLYPFRIALRPYFATSGLGFLYALGPALLLLALHYVWVVRSNVAFEEASVEASKKLAEKIAAVRAGNWQARRQTVKGKKDPFRLRPTGPAPVALLWKNLISAGQAFSMRFWVLIGVVAVSIALSVGVTSPHGGIPSAFGFIAAIFILWSLLLGPQLLRQDFRQDIASAEVLKTFPLPGWQIALGELLAPVVVLAAIQWLLILVGMVLLLQFPEPVGSLGRSGILAIGGSAAVVLPVLDLITLQIPNAAVLLFPAWFQTGKDAPQGIEATGQRIIFAFGQVLVFVVSLLPAGAAGVLVFFIFYWLLGTPAFAIPIAAAVATVVLAAEAVIGISLLGRAFERFDVGETGA